MFYLFLSFCLIISIVVGFVCGFLFARFKNHGNKETEDIIASTVSKVLLNTGEHLSRSYSERVTQAIEPFKNNMDQFRQRLEVLHNTEAKNFGELKGHMSKVFMVQQKLSTDANNLAGALKGNIKLQGEWGEEILGKLLEVSGLKKNIHYLEQPVYVNEGKRLKPDFVIKLTEGRDVILDSKVSLKSYVNYYQADQSEQPQYLSKIKESFKKHIDELSSKEYYAIEGINAPSMVLLFIPVESLFLLLVEKFPELFFEAAKKNIYITAPSLLLPLLTVIEHTWKSDAQNKNVFEMSKIAGKIYDKLVAVVSEVSNIRSSLARADKSVDSLEVKLKGKDNIVANAEKLSDMGASKTKSLPKDWQQEGFFSADIGADK